MSGLATFAVIPREDIDWERWAFAHMADHFDIARIVFQVSGRRLDLFPLNPISFDDATWIYNHAAMHQQMDAVLGIAGYDLTGVAWNNEQSLRDFVLYNYVEHQRAAQILGL